MADAPAYGERTSGGVGTFARSAAHAMLTGAPGSALGQGWPEEWVAQPDGNRAEIDALRRRTQALQNGNSLAQRSSAGPQALARSRPSSASHRGRPSSAVAAATAERRASHSGVPSTDLAPEVALAVHRPAPTRPHTAETGRRRPPVAEEEEEEDEELLNVGAYRRQAQRSLMLSHLRESSATVPGLAEMNWAQLDNQGLHAAVSAIVRVHTALHASSAHSSIEAARMQQQLSALYAAAGKSGATGLNEEQLDSIPTFVCDKAQLSNLVDAERSTCAICHEDYKEGETLRCLPECDHTYHASCIGHWLRIKAACPLCNCKVYPCKGHGKGL